MVQDAGSGATDALVIDVPVEGLQEAVAVASSFAVDGNATGKWQEGLKLPEAVPGSGALKIQAGVGRMPTILSLTGQLYDQNPEYGIVLNSLNTHCQCQQMCC